MKILMSVLAIVFLASCDGGRKEIYSKMDKSDFSCPPNAKSEISGWGKIGLSRSCKTRNGRWQGWDDGVLRVDGYYLDNKQHGEWIWYKKDGSVEKRITYEHGVEVTNSTDTGTK